MYIDDAILRHALRHVRFVNGTAYAGKSTLVARLAQQYGLIACGENFHAPLAEAVATPDRFPNLGYFETMGGWPEFLSRSPQAYTAWLDGTSEEAAQFEIALLLQMPRDRVILADTNLPLATLGRIAGYHQIAVLLSPPGMAERRFFDRGDPEKQFLLAQLRRMPDPEAALAHFKRCIAAANSPERTAALSHAGFYTYVRPEGEADTRPAVDAALARHFGLSGPPQPELRTAHLLLRPLRPEEETQAQALLTATPGAVPLSQGAGRAAATQLSAIPPADPSVKASPHLWQGGWDGASLDLAAGCALGVTRLEDGRLVGVTTLAGSGLDQPQLRFALLPEAQAFAQEAVMATLRWGVDAFSLPGLTATAEAGDGAAQQTLAACGFCRVEGGLPGGGESGRIPYCYRVG